MALHTSEKRRAQVEHENHSMETTHVRISLTSHSSSRDSLCGVRLVRVARNFSLGWLFSFRERAREFGVLSGNKNHSFGWYLTGYQRTEREIKANKIVILLLLNRFCIQIIIYVVKFSLSLASPCSLLRSWQPRVRCDLMPWMRYRQDRAIINSAGMDEVCVYQRESAPGESETHKICISIF